MTLELKPVSVSEYYEMRSKPYTQTRLTTSTVKLDGKVDGESKSGVVDAKSTDATMETGAQPPKQIGFRGRLMNDLSSIICCVEQKYYPIARDGLCLFRCELASEDETMLNKSANEIKKIALEKYSQLIELAINDACAASRIYDHFDTGGFDVIELLKSKLDIIWDLKLLRTFFSEQFLTEKNCFSCYKNTKEQINAIEIFSDTFFTRVALNFNNLSIHRADYHYMLLKNGEA